MKITVMQCSDRRLIDMLIHFESLLLAIEVGIRYDHLNGGHEHYVSNTQKAYKRVKSKLLSGGVQ